MILLTGDVPGRRAEWLQEVLPQNILYLLSDSLELELRLPEASVFC